MLNIIEGKVKRPQKVVIYGPEGIGKSTLASKFPRPLFIDTEGGTAYMNVRRVEKPDTWEGLVGIFEEVAKNPGICETLVLDTADWAEMCCIRDLCTKYKVNGLESFGYGKGYTYVGEEFARLLTACDRVIAAGMNVVITAHAKMRKQELPDEQGAFDRWEMKLSKQAAPLLKEWPDLLLFLNYKTLVVTSENNTKKATGGKRVMYTSHSPVWDAKNRFGLQEEMNMDFAGIAHLFSSAPDSTKAKAVQDPPEEAVTAPQDKLKTLMEKDGVLPIELQQLVEQRGYFKASVPVEQYPDMFLTNWVFPNWEKIVAAVESNPDRLPL